MEKCYKRLARDIINIIFPPTCIFCGEIINSGEYICNSCSKKISIIFPGYPPPQGERHYTHIYSVFLYKDLLEQTVHRIKYHHDYFSALVLGKFTGKILKSNRFNFEEYNYIIPVPTGRKRRKKRLFNQTEVILKGISREIKIPEITKITRIKQEKSQVGLTVKERSENIKEAFRLPNEQLFFGRKIIIFDDIFTTGATVNEIAKILIRAGAEKVDALTCCRGKLKS